MSSAILLAVAILALAGGYLLYSRFIARALGLGSLAETPAHTMQDGVDYVPAKMPVLLGHHFASIAGAAPIIGPVIAAQYGWMPVYLWILLGGIFLGAVHDFVTLVASVRNKGLSVGSIIERTLGPTGKLLFLIFAWATLLLVIAVFTKVVSATFVGKPQVATASILFMVLAVAFGVAVNVLRVPLWIATVVGVILLVACLYGGYVLPFPRVLEATDRADPMTTFWFVALMGYIFVASVTPVNILLQPRDYLNSFLLYAMLGLSVVAIFVSRPEVAGPALTSFDVEGLGPIFPLLFVTVACGAISGFHAMVASGTTAKQLDKETDARPVAYGGMLIESLLAIIALLSVVYVSKETYLQRLFTEHGKNPVEAFSEGISHFMVSIGIAQEYGRVFIALTVSAFALTSLDTATRLARFTLQEMFQRGGEARGVAAVVSRNRFVATAITAGAAFGLLMLGKGLSLLWQLFGAANQLLAALALMAVTVWLARTGRRNLFTRIPMVVMYLVTLSALALKLVDNVEAGNWVITGIVVLLIGLAFALGVTYLRSDRTAQTGAGGLS
ncbi:MAG: carbon starvation protein A [Pseudomonadota bacterium]